ncbi:hypothetical protein BV25DRAFT_610807 [Artomyces pyxidatus]|uniref:Uncharacterized protein n=1 Tax=Artomyces pyxidatus TaxID=48021 RepID=A0ACB8T1X3_9AGAM|nr:hypothetical protein BV25DRAFT_610807 [Artomyces pyxidatus]
MLLFRSSSLALRHRRTLRLWCTRPHAPGASRTMFALATPSLPSAMSAHIRAQCLSFSWTERSAQRLSTAAQPRRSRSPTPANAHSSTSRCCRATIEVRDDIEWEAVFSPAGPCEARGCAFTAMDGGGVRGV